MFAIPVFSPVYQLEIREEGILLFNDNEQIVLQGDACCRLAPLLNGSYHIDQIINQLQHDFPPEEIYYLLFHMRDQGYIIDYSKDRQQLDQVYWNPKGLPDHAEIPCNKTVTVYWNGITEQKQLYDYLETLPISIQKEQAADLSILITNDYTHPAISAIHENSYSSGASVLLARPIGRLIWLGPLLTPQKTGCLDCLLHRIKLHYPSLSASPLLHSKTSPTAPEVILHTGIHLISCIVSDWIYNNDSCKHLGVLTTFDPLTCSTQKHKLIRRPQCRTCNDTTYVQQTEPIEVETDTVSLNSSGYRITPPRHSFDKYKHHISSITGVVRSLQRMEVANTDLIHCYTSNHPSSYNHKDINSWISQMKDLSGGKGRNDVQAKTSGLFESLERYSAIFDGTEHTIESAYAPLAEEAIDPRECLLFSENQYAMREEWNQKQNGHFQFIPERFDESKDISWTPAWSLTSNEFKYVPTAMCFFGFPGKGKNYAQADSNGLAAGNSLQEAIIQGFFELIERDAVAIWWYNKLHRPMVDLDSFQDPYYDNLTRYYQSIGREFWVLDITTDLEFPVFVAVSRKKNAAEEEILLGFGAHNNASIALNRAICEINQSLPITFLSNQERIDQLMPDYKDVLDWWTTANVGHHEYLIPHGNTSKKREDFFNSQPKYLNEALSMCIEAVNKKALDVLIVDMTRPDIKVPVVKVIIPGLRHFWRRLAPGRLYDVPILLGDRMGATKEIDLNPVSMFL